ncbi:MAG: peroxiredoxin [Planctomycetes bacterium]|nr:peroxiredoxin [Planctomycetota bacterium]MCB9888880.1 peroxiredoxin [Planctomycetota bacterium]
MCSLRDAAKSFAKLQVKVYGISFDDVSSQASFARKHGLAYPLLSDPDQSVGRKYGVTRAGGRPFAQRVTFVIDDLGVLRHVSSKVAVSTHGAELVELIEKLRAARK